ncbi:MAG TPA: hypothetical protein PLV68_09405, partial [Ilumatobacteraceae bacterium]|nr:hypothetical protein [Ilumatobacteraceae bacterium]
MELTSGDATQTSIATRWTDVDLADGTAVALVLGTDGIDRLRADLDGDGTPETIIAPNVVVDGAIAADTDAPEVSIVATAPTNTNANTQYAVVATNTESGVARTLWSTDGESFALYDGPLALDASATPTIWAFAEDHAGNRSPMRQLRLAGAPLVPFTTTSVSPAPNPGGWSRGTVSVEMHAAA